MRGFLDGMLDATALVDRLRAQIPAPWRKFRDLPFPTRISDSLTLSTFHGCPPDEIEAIVMHLIDEVGLDVVVKLNPTLLGRDELDAILHDRLGYGDIVGARARLRRGRDLGRGGGASSNASTPTRRRAGAASG